MEYMGGEQERIRRMLVALMYIATKQLTSKVGNGILNMERKELHWNTATARNPRGAIPGVSCINGLTAATYPHPATCTCNKLLQMP